MKTIIGIDPGQYRTAFAVLSGNIPVDSYYSENALLRDEIARLCTYYAKHDILVAIEMVSGYGMNVGRSVFETAYTVGKIVAYCEQCNIPVKLVYRKDVKMALFGNMKQNDKTIRAKMIELYGEKVKGYAGDKWQALAVATISNISYSNEGEK